MMSNNALPCFLVLHLAATFDRQRFPFISGELQTSERPNRSSAYVSFIFARSARLESPTPPGRQLRRCRLTEVACSPKVGLGKAARVMYGGDTALSSTFLFCSLPSISFSTSLALPLTRLLCLLLEFNPSIKPLRLSK